MRVRAVALSLVVHAVLLALIAHVRRRAAERQEAVEIELAEVPAVEPPPAETPPAAGTPPAHTEEARPQPRAQRSPGRARPAPPAPEAAAGAIGEPAEEGLGLGWSLGALGSGGGAGGGSGAGAGGRGGHGRGAAPTVRPAPRHVSKARPPRLVYPKRFRDEREGEVFVAILTIDEDGWVVGVRLKKGVNPWADQKAADAVWRFHYDPALDDAGRPVRARVEQRFMVD